MIRIAILASGSGTNAQRLVEHFNDRPDAQVVLIGCDQPSAGVVQRAWDLGVPLYLFNGTQLRSGDVLRELQGQRVDLVVLAGFLRLIPATLIAAYPRRIINLHPSLLPNYGGKGMYGHHVHEAVIARGAQWTGVTIHLVTENYDEGPILRQRVVAVRPDDTSETLGARVLALEHDTLWREVRALLERA